MRREHVLMRSLATGESDLLVYGHYGRPLLWFPSDKGRAVDFEGNGLLDAIRWLVDAGRVKVYCVDSYDAASWRNDDLPLEERARAHQRFEDFVLNDVVPAIHTDSPGALDLLVGGCSFGAFHAANFALRRAEVFPLALCLSGVYDMSHLGWGERGEAIEQEACDLLGVRNLRGYFSRPTGFFADHLRRYSKSRRQAPIYWPLSTASGSYMLWISYHRLT